MERGRQQAERVGAEGRAASSHRLGVRAAVGGSGRGVRRVQPPPRGEGGRWAGRGGGAWLVAEG